MRTLVIGDIHGCYAELLELLEKTGPASDDKIIALGDIVDRGPETPQVLDFFQSKLNAASLLGNHERKHLRWYRGELHPALSQRISCQQIGPGYIDAVAWMATLPLFLDLPKAILVHGYLEPGVPLEKQRGRVLTGTMGGESYLHANYNRPWYELWDSNKPVIVGHLDYLRNGKPFVYQDRVFFIDTSCVHGGCLTGLMLPEFRFYSINSREDHWSRVRNLFKRERAARLATPMELIDYKVPWDEEREQGLEKILGAVKAENKRLLAHLQSTPGFEQLTARQQAKAYAALVSEFPAEGLFHLARRGELTKERARRILREANRVEDVLEKLDILE
jgi:hypothetical protein